MLKFQGAPLTYMDVLSHFNLFFTLLFTIEAVLKLTSFGPKVNLNLQRHIESEFNLQIFVFPELFQRFLEYIWFHHRGGKYHRCHKNCSNRVSQVIPRCQIDKTAPQKCQCQNFTLHLCSVLQGKMLMMMSNSNFEFRLFPMFVCWWEFSSLFMQLLGCNCLEVWWWTQTHQLRDTTIFVTFSRVCSACSGLQQRREIIHSAN